MQRAEKRIKQVQNRIYQWEELAKSDEPSKASMLEVGLQYQREYLRELSRGENHPGR